MKIGDLEIDDSEFVDVNKVSTAVELRFDARSGAVRSSRCKARRVTTEAQARSVAPRARRSAAATSFDRLKIVPSVTK